MHANTEDTRFFLKPDLLTPDECDAIIERNRGKTKVVEGPGKNDESEWNWHCQVHAHGVDDIRDLCGVAPRLFALFSKINRQTGWNAPLDVARFGVSRYSWGDGMGTHVDDESRGPRPWDLPHRGVSMSVSLTDPDDYKGGALRIYDGETWHTPLAGKPRGTAVLFGSSTLHKVEHVTGGERFVLLGWAYANHIQRGIK